MKNEGHKHKTEEINNHRSSLNTNKSTDNNKRQSKTTVTEEREERILGFGLNVFQFVAYLQHG